MQAFSGSCWRESTTHSNEGVSQERRRYGIQEIGDPTQERGKGDREGRSLDGSSAAGTEWSR